MRCVWHPFTVNRKLEWRNEGAVAFKREEQEQEGEWKKRGILINISIYNPSTQALDLDHDQQKPTLANTESNTKPITSVLLDINQSIHS